MKFFTRSKLSRKKQGKSNRNYKAFLSLTKVGFTPAQARRMLIAGNNIRVNRLAHGKDITPPTIFAVIYGKRQNPESQAILSDALEIPIKDLFPENEASHV